MSKQKVLVGMSGGVDSSLAAALLVEAGYDVTGVFLKVWSEEEFLDPRITNYELRITGSNPVRLPAGEAGRTSYVGLDCPWQQDLADARAVADQLGIELIVRNVQREYWDRVVSTFIDGYRTGLTPNPDILCNSQIKFGILYEWARAQGFEHVATGHYARLSSKGKVSSIEYSVSRDGPRYQILDTRYGLHRGIDAKKDQTYFLWNVDRSKLAHILFPIGHLTKVQVREEAANRGLATAGKKDSQGICFLGKVNVRAWLREELGTEAGEVVDRRGRVIGTHDGAQLYTLGQRHGFDVRSTTHESRAMYVVERDLKANRLVVDMASPQSRELVATQLNWLVDEIPKAGDWIEARIRHGQVPQAATVESRITNHESRIQLRFAEPQTAIAPGQSVVFSNNSRVLGGGIIA